MNATLAHRGYDPKFSPGGERICFWRGGKGLVNSEIFVISTAGGDEREVKTGLLGASQPIWTPDGNALLFLGTDGAGQRTGGPGLDWWVHTLETGDTTPTLALDRVRQFDLYGILPGVGRLLTPSSWLLENHEVIFDARSGEDARLWKLKISPESWRAISDPEPIALETGIVSQPSGSDSGSIAFSRMDMRLDIAGVPVSTNASTTELTRLVPDVTPTASRVTISRDGSKIAFISTQSGYNNVRVMGLADGEIRSLTDTSAYEYHPLISPDGKWVAYLAGREMFVVSSSGGVPKRVCGNCGGPRSWSSDSSRILMEGMALRSLDVATGEIRQLAEHSTAPFFDPRFSPDDDWIAFHMPVDELGNRIGARRKLFVARLNHEALAPEDEWVQITDGTAYEGFSGWSVDGNALYYFSDRSGPLTIRRQNLDPGTKRPISEPDEIVRLSRHQYGHAPLSHGELQLAVSEDRIVFHVPDLKGDVWLMEPREER